MSPVVRHRLFKKTKKTASNWSMKYSGVYYSYTLFKAGIKLGKAVCTCRDTRLCVISVQLYTSAYRRLCGLGVAAMLTYADVCRSIRMLCRPTLVFLSKAAQ
jgi:uncharacterized RDD family membrane protein YckC